MNRLPVVLLLAAVASSCSGTPEVPEAAPPVKADFRWRPLSQVRFKINSEFSFTERAGGGDNDRLFWKGSMSGTFEILVIKTDLAVAEATIKPLEFEYRLGDRLVTFRDSKLERNALAEHEDLTLPTEPCRVLLHHDGLLRDMEPADGWRFIGSMVGERPSLVSWLGPLGEMVLTDGWSQSDAREVQLVHGTALPLRIVGAGSRRPGGWNVRYAVGVNRQSGRFEWLADCVESGTGSLDLDETGRPQKAAIDWSAKTADGIPVANFKWTSEFTY